MRACQEAPHDQSPLIDAHCHWFSNPFFQALAEESPMAGTVHQRMALVQESTGLQMPDEDDSVHRRNWLAEMEESSVDRLVIFSSHPKESGTVAEAAAAAPKQLTGVAVINPTAENAAQKARTLLVERGMRGCCCFPPSTDSVSTVPWSTPCWKRSPLCRECAMCIAACFKVPCETILGSSAPPIPA